MVYLLIIAYIIFWGVTLTIKYLSLGYFDWDLAFFNQAMWNLLNGSVFSSLFNINIFANHGNFIAFIFLPIYALFANALFLIYLKVALMALAVIPLFLIARDNLNYKYGLFFALLYFLYPGLNYALAYEFDWENLSVFFIMWLFYFYYKKQFGWFCAASVLLCMVKENMPLVVFMFGLYALLEHRPKKWFLCPVILGGLWFYMCVFLLMPSLSVTGYDGRWLHYPALSAGIFGSLKSLFNNLDGQFIIQLFSPLLFIPVLSPAVLSLGLPVFLQHMLSKQYSEHTIYFAYASSLIPFIFISGVFGVKFLIKHFQRRFRYFMGLVVFSAIAYTLIFDFELTPLIESIYSNAKHELNQTRKDFLRMVPKDSSVIATFAFLPPLSGRRNLYAFEDLYYHMHYDKPWPMPQDIEYALVDFNDFYLAGRLKHIPSGYKQIADFLGERGFGVARAVNDIVLFKSGYPAAFKLFEARDEINFKGKSIITLGQSLDFAFDRASLSASSGQVVGLKFYWHCLVNPVANFGIRLSLVGNKGSVAYTAHHAAGYRIRPTSFWGQGEFIEENYNLLIPPLPEGRYFLIADFFNCDTGGDVYIASKEGAAVAGDTAVDMGVVDIHG